MNALRLVPPKPAEITLETLPQLFAHNRALYGGFRMEDPPARPDGISEEEWTALGEPGQRAIVREREARTAAERSLAAARARPGPPKPKGDDSQQEPTGGGAAAPDADAVAQAVAKAMEAAMKPVTDFMAKQQEAEEQRAAEQAASKVVDEVMKAAKGQFKPDEKGSPLEFHNPANALTMIDLTKVVDANGAPDPAKIQSELLGLLQREKHLGKVVDTRRTAAPSSGAGAGGADTPIGDRVKDTLARMQQAQGIKPSATTT